MFDGERGQSGGVEVDVLARHEDITMVSPRTSHVMPALTAGGRGGGGGYFFLCCTDVAGTAGQ